MANPLAVASGGSDALEATLERMVAEHLAQQKETETGRHNLADEGLKGRQIDEQSADRKLRESDLNDVRKARATTQAQVSADRTASMRPIGSSVTDDEFNKETGTGIPMGSYRFSPGNMGMSTPDGGVGPTSDIRTWLGTQDQITKAATAAKEKSGGDYNTETKTVTVDGQPVEAIYDPREYNANGSKGTYRSVKTGEDITSKVGHYEKPPAPDRVLIQTGDGYMPRDAARKTLADGGSVPLPETSATRTMGEGARMLAPHITQVQQMAEDLDKKGLFGPVMSRVRQLGQKAGTIDEFAALIGEDPDIHRDKEAGEFATTLGLLATGAGRVHGGARGGGSPQMYQHFKDMLSDAGTLQMFEGRLSALDKFMTGYAAGPTGKGAPAPSTTAPKEIVYGMDGKPIPPKD